MTKPIVRFAPSPTGHLHLGVARTALFNWLFARSQGGRILLRIEDTDKERSHDDYTRSLQDDLHWLGLDFDGPVMIQSKNRARHIEIVSELLDRGLAYRTSTPTENATEEHWRSKLRDKSSSAKKSNQPATGTVVRLKVQNKDNGKSAQIDDMVQGQVNFPRDQLDDFVLLRSDGSPTYMLAVVVDDHDQGITHVIRGSDHLANAFRQAELYQSLSWPVPKFAHLPLIHTQKGKMSKRDADSEGIAVNLDFYRHNGYLPEAMRNVLLRLGWGSGNQERITTTEALEIFKISDVGKSSARFDLAKCDDYNRHYLRQIDPDRLWKLWQEFFPPSLSDEAVGKLRAAAPIIVSRHANLMQAAQASSFLTQSKIFPLADQKASAIFVESDQQTTIERLQTIKKQFENNSLDELMASLKTLAKENDISFGIYARLLRVALTGSMQSPDLGDVMRILGAKVCLSRLDDAIEQRSLMS